MSMNLRREPVRQRDIVSFGRRTPRFNFEVLRAEAAAERAAAADTRDFEPISFEPKQRHPKSLYLEQGASLV